METQPLKIEWFMEEGGVLGSRIKTVDWINGCEGGFCVMNTANYNILKTLILKI